MGQNKITPRVERAIESNSVLCGMQCQRGGVDDTGSGQNASASHLSLGLKGFALKRLIHPKLQIEKIGIMHILERGL